MFDRIGRRDDETPFVVEWLVRHSIAVWSVCEGEQRFDNHVDKLTNYIRYWQAAGESERISERTRTRIRQLTEEGHFTGGICPYGYQLVRQGRVNKRGQPLYDLVIRPEHAKIVQLIYEKSALEGLGNFRIANLLNYLEIPSPSGKTWNYATLYHILENPLYKGDLHKGGTISHQENLRIISDELFDKAQFLHHVQLERKSAERTVPILKGKALLSGFLYCGTCGSRMGSNHLLRYYRRTDGTISTYRTQKYYCCRRVNGEPVPCDGQRTFVANRVNTLCLEQLPEKLVPLFQESPTEIAGRQGAIWKADTEQELEALEADRKEITEEISLLRSQVLACLKGESHFTHAQLSSMLSDAEQRHAEICGQIEFCQGKLKKLNDSVWELQFQIEKYHRLWKEFPDAAIERKKVILSHFLENVKISRGYELSVTLSQKITRILSLVN